MVSSAVEIANLALAKIGHEGFITSFEEGSKGARYMNQFYEPMRQVLLRSKLWKFARKRATLAPLVEQPAFDEGYYFQYPDDCIRIVGTDREYFERGERWLREGDRIIADTEALNIVYIRNIKDVAKFDPMFIDVFASRLGYEASMPIMKSQQVKEQMGAEYNRSLIRAANAGATETDGLKFIAEAFIQARL